MGGRMLPIDCEHGVTVDWGDFGPCQNCDTDHSANDDGCPNYVACPKCDAHGEAVMSELARKLEIANRFDACHRSGQQIDVGPKTVGSANDLYIWLLHGDLEVDG